MKLSLKALSLAFGILWGASFLVIGIVNLIWPTYGTVFLQFGESIYPGYHYGAGFGSVIVATLYALLDGLICAGIFGWLYNCFAAPKAAGAA